MYVFMSPYVIEIFAALGGQCLSYHSLTCAVVGEVSHPSELDTSFLMASSTLQHDSEDHYQNYCWGQSQKYAKHYYRGRRVND